MKDELVTHIIMTKWVPDENGKPKMETEKLYPEWYVESLKDQLKEMRMWQKQDYEEIERLKGLDKKGTE